MIHDLTSRQGCLKPVLINCRDVSLKLNVGYRTSLRSIGWQAYLWECVFLQVLVGTNVPSPSLQGYGVTLIYSWMEVSGVTSGCIEECVFWWVPAQAGVFPAHDCEVQEPSYGPFQCLQLD